MWPTRNDGAGHSPHRKRTPPRFSLTNAEDGAFIAIQWWGRIRAPPQRRRLPFTSLLFFSFPSEHHNWTGVGERGEVEGWRKARGDNHNLTKGNDHVLWRSGTVACPRHKCHKAFCPLALRAGVMRPHVNCFAKDLP